MIPIFWEILQVSILKVWPYKLFFWGDKGKCDWLIEFFGFGTSTYTHAISSLTDLPYVLLPTVHQGMMFKIKIKLLQNKHS